jgi:hypothetical protein
LRTAFTKEPDLVDLDGVIGGRGAALERVGGAEAVDERWRSQEANGPARATSWRA